MNKLLYCAALMVATTACGPALHPFYTSSDLYEDAALEGRWTNNEDTFEFRRTCLGRYEISECAPDCKHFVSAALFRIGGQPFLDIQEPKDAFSSAILPHGVIRLRVKADQVESAVTALSEAHGADGDTVETAAANTGLPADKLQEIVGHIGGEGSLGQFASLLQEGGGAGGIMGKLSGLFGSKE